MMTGCYYCGAMRDEITSHGPDAICCETVLEVAA